MNPEAQRLQKTLVELLTEQTNADELLWDEIHGISPLGRKFHSICEHGQSYYYLTKYSGWKIHGSGLTYGHASGWKILRPLIKAIQQNVKRQNQGREKKTQTLHRAHQIRQIEKALAQE